MGDWKGPVGRGNREEIQQAFSTFFTRKQDGAGSKRRLQRQSTGTGQDPPGAAQGIDSKACLQEGNYSWKSPRTWLILGTPRVFSGEELEVLPSLKVHLLWLVTAECSKTALNIF